MKRFVACVLLFSSIGLVWSQADPFFEQQKTKSQVLLWSGIGSAIVGTIVTLISVNDMSKNTSPTLPPSFWFSMLGGALVGGGAGLAYVETSEVQRWNIAIHYALEFTPGEVEAIKAGRVFIGMSRNALLASWGYPDHINRTIVSSTTQEQFVYGTSYYRKYAYVEHGKVTALQD